MIMASTTVFKVPLRRNFSDSHLADKIIEDYAPPEESGTTGSSKWDVKGIEKSRSASNSPVSCTKSELIDKKLEPRALTYQIPEKLNRSQLSSSQELLAHYASYLKNPVTTEQLQNLSKTAKQWTKYTLSMYKYYVNGKEDLPSDIKQDELMFSKVLQHIKKVLQDISDILIRSCPECQYNNYALSKVLTSVMQGYRTCGLCSQVFCYQHTSFKRRVSINNSLNKSNVSTHQLFELDPDGSWIHVCKRCFEKDKDQTLGQTKDHSSTFVERRAKKNNLREKRQDKILKKLEKLSQEEPDDTTSTSFSLWSVATALPLKIPVSVPFSSASSSKSCNICSIDFSFWTKSQSCQLCSFECCSSCCQYTVPLSKSLVNPNAPENRQGDLSICKYCHDLISSKKKRIKFSLLCNSEETKKLVQMYQFASDLKREIDKRLEEYLSKTSTLESSILDSFLLVSEDDDSPTEVNFSESVRTESQQLFDNLLPMFIEYEKIVQQLLSVPCSTEKQRRIMHNLKVAFMQSQAYTVIAQQRMAETLQRKQASQQ